MWLEETVLPPRPVIDTAAVADRRAVRFASIEDVLRDAELIAAAARDGRLKRLGNWSAGQTFGHVAAWIGFSFDGYPGAASPEQVEKALPWREKVLQTGLRPGFRFAAADTGTWGDDDLMLDDGLNRLKTAFARLRRNAPTQVHPLFGEYSHSEWIHLHLRHAELHHGFLVPIAPGARR